MPFSDEFLEYVVDQLGQVGNIRVKKMFGGAGIYTGEIFFALIADDVLYFKVDDTNRPDYEAKGMGPFIPFDNEKYVMQYYAVPAEVLEDNDDLSKWAQKSISVALKKSAGKKKRH